MKRILSYLFVLIFTVSMLDIFSNIALATDNTENKLNYNEYSTLLRDMVEKYSGNDNTSLNVSSNSISESNRLIVKTNTNDLLDNDCNAIEKIEGYNCWHILQYEDNTSATSALSFYNSEPYVIYVEFDEPSLLMFLILSPQRKMLYHTHQPRFRGVAMQQVQQKQTILFPYRMLS